MNCSQFGGQPFQPCSFTVTRKGGGTAQVIVAFPDGSKRSIDFTKGKAVKADAAGEIKQERWHDLNTVYVGDNERFEIPDAILFGG